MARSNGASSRATRANGETEESTQERLMRGAARLFRTKGFGHTSTRELAAVAGVQSASLYHYMEGKEDLLYDICVQGNQLMYTAVSAAIAETDTPLTGIQATIRTHLLTAIESRDIYLTTLSEMRALSPSRQRRITADRGKYADLLEDLITRAQDAGDVRSDIPARHLSLVLRNILAWTLIWFSLEGEMTIDQLADVMTTVFLDGAGA